MSGQHKWEDIVARSFPEVVNARFPRGTKARLEALAASEMNRIQKLGLEYGDAVKLSPSAVVRRAVLEYLDREEKKSAP